MRLFAVLLIAFCTAAQGQVPGWSYSPVEGEGDRASLGCAAGSDRQNFACLAVRCDDDYSVGFYIHTSRKEGDVGQWEITIDKEVKGFEAEGTEAPYNARVTGDIGWLRDRIEQGGLAYLNPLWGEPLARNSISLVGSLYAIQEALAFCAPRAPKNGDAPVPAERSQ